MLILYYFCLWLTTVQSLGLGDVTDVASASQKKLSEPILMEMYADPNLFTATGFNEDSVLNFTQKANKYGYLTEVHEVVTEDFYILTVFRMKNSSCTSLKSKPVLMWHGLFETSDAFILAGPETGLGYFVADECYDVWFGNNRGNGYSNKHLNYSSDASNFKFWNFTYDQFGYYDMPAVIDYILEETNNAQLYYIGHSLGTTQFFILASTRTEYNNKIALSICLGPTAYLGHVIGPLKLLAPFFNLISDAFAALKKYNLISRDDPLAVGENILCQYLPTLACGSIFYALLGVQPQQVSRKTLQVASGSFPAQTSIFSLAQSGQAVVSNKFQKYDYGDNNIEVYGTTDVPQYNVSAITTPVAFFSGSSDWLATEIDVKRISVELPNLVYHNILSDWDHLEFVWGKYIPTILAPKVFEVLSRY